MSVPSHPVSVVRDQNLVSDAESDLVAEGSEGQFVERPFAVRSPIATTAKWCAFIAVSALALRPILIAPVVADDLVMPFSQIGEHGTNPIGIWRWAVSSAPTVGHFNFLGQIVGSTTTLVWTWLMSSGLRFTTVFGATKLLVYVLCAVAAGRFVRNGLGLAGVVVPVWWSRVVCAIALFSTLQIHMAWSNDPVASYPGSGFASAALALFYLSVVVSFARTPSWRGAGAVAALGAAAILYYEINAAVVVAASPIVLWMLLDGGRYKTISGWGKAAVALGAPTVMTVVIQILVSPASGNYTGTQIAAHNSPSETFRIAMLGSLPGAGWRMSREWLAYPVPMRTVPAVSITALLLCIWCLAKRFGVRPLHVRSGGFRWGAFGAVLAAPFLFWMGSTMIQALTQKVQDEVNQVGKVYNFYAMGATCFAVISVLVWVAIPATKWTIRIAPVAVAVAVLFASIQYVVNSELSRRVNEVVLPSRELLVAYSDTWSQEERCRVVRTWAAGDWPAYYEDQVVVGLEAAFQRFRGESFCEGFDRVQEGLGEPR